jgi:DNA-binding transcriptional LysR family regulator
MISRRIAALEREIGGKLFERTSRQVRLTAVGAQFRDELLPGYQQLEQALDNARNATRTVSGQLRVGFTNMTEGAALTRLVRAYEEKYPDSAVALQQVPVFDPYRDLRSGRVDVLVNWLADDQPDLVAGPAIEHQQRVLAVSSQHLLAQRETVSIEDLADWPVARIPPDYPLSLWEAIVPHATPSGRLISRTELVHDTAEAWALVARGVIVHPGMDSMRERLSRDDIVLVPIRDLPPMPLGLIWCRTRENARIRAIAEVAALTRAARRRS